MEDQQIINENELEKVAGGSGDSTYAIIWYCPDCDSEHELFSGEWADVEWEMEHPPTCPFHPQTTLIFHSTKMI